MLPAAQPCSITPSRSVSNSGYFEGEEIWDFGSWKEQDGDESKASVQKGWTFPAAGPCLLHRNRNFIRYIPTKDERVVTIHTACSQQPAQATGAAV